jgi:hypothetical protein
MSHRIAIAVTRLSLNKDELFCNPEYGQVSRCTTSQLQHRMGYQ